jgi:hypothetical protein
LSDISLPNLSVTTNGGINWQTYSAGAGTQSVGTIKWIPGTNIYYLAANNIKRTSNGGLSWQVMSAAGCMQFSHMDLVLTGTNQICAYALCEDGRVFKYQGEPFGVKQISIEVPQDFALLQNYPNPFNPVTHFRFRIADFRLVTIQIYDVLGNSVSVLVNDKLSPGFYEAEFDGSSLSSGIYYYKLTAGDFSDSKKMVLLK